MVLFRCNDPRLNIAYIDINVEDKILRIVYKDFLETRQKIELR